MDTVINISGTPLSERYIDVLLKCLSLAQTCTTTEFDSKIDSHGFSRNSHLKAWYSIMVWYEQKNLNN